MNLDLKVAIRRETFKDILRLMDETKGIKTVLMNLPFYGQGYLVDYLKKDCLVYTAISQEDNCIEAVFIFKWLECEYNAVCLSVCTMNNKYQWGKYYRDEVEPEIKKHADYLVGFLPADKKGIVRLYKRYGYTLEFNEEMNQYIYLQNLS